MPFWGVVLKGTSSVPYATRSGIIRFWPINVAKWNTFVLTDPATFAAVQSRSDNWMRMEEKEQRTESQWRRTPPFKPLYMDGDLAVFDVNEVLIRERHGELRLDFFMLIFCRQGEIRVSMNTHELQLNKHEILVCRPNDQLYETVVTDDFQGTLICLSQRAIQDTIRLDSQVWHRAFVLGECPVLRITAQENELFNRYSQLMAFRTQLKGRLYSKEVMAALTRAILLDLLANFKSADEAQTEGAYRRKDLLFQAFMKKLTSMEVKPRSVTWYADQLCVTPKYLTSVCRKSCGRSAFELINEAVLTDIRYQLKYSQKSIKEVADYLDFPNISFFGKYVRNHVGCSPKEYRRRLL